MAEEAIGPPENEAFMAGALREVERHERRPAKSITGAINPDWLPPKLDVIDPCSFQGQGVPERGWLVDGWIPMRTVSILGGDGGTGKSLAAMQLVTAAVSGGFWLGLAVARMRALYFSCEDEEDELHRRQHDINQALGIDYADLDGLQWDDRVGEDNLLYAPTFDEKGYRGPPEATEIYHSIKLHCLAEGIQLIVLDSLHDVFGGNENSRPEVRRFVGALIGLARDINGAVVLLAHPSLSGRNSGTGESGSTAWNAAVRSRLYLHKPPEGEDADENERLLTRKKANYATAGDTIRLQWVDGAFVAKDQPGGILATLDRNRARTVFLELLERREKENRPVSHKARSGNYAPTEFAKHPNRQGYRKADRDPTGPAQGHPGSSSFPWQLSMLFDLHPRCPLL